MMYFNILVTTEGIFYRKKCWNLQLRISKHCVTCLECDYDRKL